MSEGSTPANFQIKVPDDLVRATIMAELAKAMPDRETFIAKLVNEVLKDKGRLSGKWHTYFENTIRAHVVVIFDEELEIVMKSQDDAIRTIIREQINKMDITTSLQQRAKKLKATIRANVNFEDDEDD